MCTCQVNILNGDIWNKNGDKNPLKYLISLRSKGQYERSVNLIYINVNIKLFNIIINGMFYLWRCELTKHGGRTRTSCGSGTGSRLRRKRARCGSWACRWWCTGSHSSWRSSSGRLRCWCDWRRLKPHKNNSLNAKKHNYTGHAGTNM